MDIQPAVAAKSSTTSKPGVDKPETDADSTGARTSGTAFSQLLQGWQGGGVTEDASAAALLPSDAAAAALGTALPVAAWDVESLLGQTRQMDAVQLDAALADGSLLEAQRSAGVQLAAQTGSPWGAQPRIAAGQSVATVAAGVQPATLDAQASLPVAAAATVLTQQVGEVAQAGVDALADGLRATAMEEGRIGLSGAWQLEEAPLPASMAALRVPQGLESVLASAGMAPKAQECSAQGAAASGTGAEGLGAAQGSATRLTENAVQATQQAQNAVLDMATDAPVEDMRFWVQGKNQRAEVVLEHDEQPVRVQVTVRGNEAHVMFRADQAQTRDMLDASLAQLREMLAQQGLELGSVSVQAQASEDAPGQQQAPRNPWESAPVQHATVAVPVAQTAAGAAAVRPLSPGLDVYA